MKSSPFGVAALALLMPVVGALGQTGTITGTIGYAGQAPKPETVVVTKDQDICGKTVPSRKLIVKDRMVQNAVVHLEGAAGEAPAGQVELTNRECSFEPPVLAAGSGSTLKIGNEDPILHNTHLRHRHRTVANLALSRQGVAIENSRALRRPGLVEAECDTHEWMSAKIWVFDHPYFAVSDEAGAFEIAGVPEGTYTLKVWHEVLGEQQQTVTVRADATTSVDFVFEASGAAAGGG